MPVSRTRGLRSETQKQIAPGLLTGAISLKDCQTKSGLALLRVRGFFALRLQFSELLRRQNSFGVTEKCLAAFLRAVCLHAFGLPGLNLSLLIGCEIQRGQINAFH